MLKIALAIFLIAHGLVHAGLAAAPNPADPNAKPLAFFTAVERSWLLPRLGMDGTAVYWNGRLLDRHHPRCSVNAGVCPRWSGYFRRSRVKRHLADSCHHRSNFLLAVAHPLLASLAAGWHSNQCRNADRLTVG